MQLLEISLEQRVIVGISGMVLLFTAFIIAFVVSQRKKLQYHKELHALHQEQKRILTGQKIELEKTVKERTEEVLQQKEEIQAQRDNLEQTLDDLRSTQSQLIQREKMASLGELTAGIAHEIQNPLNFVNNFSDVGIELIGELYEELKNNDPEEVMAVANSIRENLERIHHHGKRADNIVKGMLEHSKVDTGKIEPTDINKLAAESLHLSYNAFCAKDNTFNASCETVLDENVKEVAVVPQALKRVLVNLCSNAFYAVKEKKSKAGENYQPKVSVTTRADDHSVLITVSDNGTGISQNILQKIFQPFFTTKPTGEGTGLGLSLSYDIIRAHGGELTAESVDGDGAVFVIRLPV